MRIPSNKPLQVQVQVQTQSQPDINKIISDLGNQKHTVTQILLCKKNSASKVDDFELVNLMEQALQLKLSHEIIGVVSKDSDGVFRITSTTSGLSSDKHNFLELKKNQVFVSIREEGGESLLSILDSQRSRCAIKAYKLKGR